MKKVLVVGALLAVGPVMADTGTELCLSAAELVPIAIQFRDEGYSAADTKTLILMLGQLETLDASVQPSVSLIVDVVVNYTFKRPWGTPEQEEASFLKGCLEEMR